MFRGGLNDSAAWILLLPSDSVFHRIQVIVADRLTSITPVVIGDRMPVYEMEVKLNEGLWSASQAPAIDAVEV